MRTLRKDKSAGKISAHLRRLRANGQALGRSKVHALFRTDRAERHAERARLPALLRQKTPLRQKPLRLLFRRRAARAFARPKIPKRDVRTLRPCEDCRAISRSGKVHRRRDFGASSAAFSQENQAPNTTRASLSQRCLRIHFRTRTPALPTF